LPLRILQVVRDKWTGRSWPRELLIFAGLVAAYVATAKLGFRAALVAEQVSPAWPPSGLALWAVLVLRRRAWPAIWTGALIANLVTDVPLLPAISIAIGNTLEAIVGAWLLREFADVDRSLDRLRQVTALNVLDRRDGRRRLPLHGGTAGLEQLRPVVADVVAG
jgi:integral membrane sensor domain MASE1